MANLLTGAAIRGARVRLGMTQATASARVGVTPDTWRLWELGRVAPGPRHREWLAAFVRDAAGSRPGKSLTAAMIRKARATVGESQVEFAARLGVAERSVKNWEQGTNLPRSRATTRAILELINDAKTR